MSLYQQEQQQEAGADILKAFISSRDITTESFLREIFDSLPEPPNSSAVELKSMEGRGKKENCRSKCHTVTPCTTYCAVNVGPKTL